MPALYGADYPYGIPPSGLGNAAAVKAATRDQLATFHDTWIRPDNARIFVVGDTPLAEVKTEIDATHGERKATATSNSEQDRTRLVWGERWAGCVDSGEGRKIKTKTT